MNVAIIGYGNLGRGVEIALAQQPDMTGVGIFTRRDPKTLTSLGLPVYALDTLTEHDDIDVCILCGGSATDLIEQTPSIVRHFNVVDSFDTHAKIPEHFATVEKNANDSDHLAMISTGWDPGLFSVQRLIAQSILPNGDTHTFWGRGVSQGHSDAIRRIDGVKMGVQYTVPKNDALKTVRRGEGSTLTTRDKHSRICYVVLEEGADPETIRQSIITMPHYFDEYDTEVHFITEEEMRNEHMAMPHGGRVLRYGHTQADVSHQYEFSLQLSSNPQFTAAVNVACARAVYRAHQAGMRGCVTIFDLPLSYLSPLAPKELYRTIL